MRSKHKDAPQACSAVTHLVGQLFVVVCVSLLTVMQADAQDTQAIESFRDGAVQGDALAQYELGRAYANGDGVQQSYTQAFRWFLTSAKQGHQPAAMALSKMYSHGDGVDRDPAEAEKWRRRASLRGRLIEKDAVPVETSISPSHRPEQLRASSQTSSPHTIGIELSDLMAILLPDSGKKFAEWTVEADTASSIEWKTDGIESSDDVRMGTLRRDGTLVLLLKGKPAYTRLAKTVIPGEWDLTLHGMRWGYGAITLKQVIEPVQVDALGEKNVEKYMPGKVQIVKKCEEFGGYDNLYAVQIDGKAPVWVKEMQSCGSFGCSTTFTIQFEEQSASALRCLSESESVVNEEANTTTSNQASPTGTRIADLPMKQNAAEQLKNTAPNTAPGTSVESAGGFEGELNKACVGGKMLEELQKQMVLSKTQEQHMQSRLPAFCRCLAGDIATTVPDPSSSVRDALIRRVSVRPSSEELFRKWSGQDATAATDYSALVWFGAFQRCVDKSGITNM